MRHSLFLRGKLQAANQNQPEIELCRAKLMFLGEERVVRTIADVGVLLASRVAIFAPYEVFDV